MKGALHILRLIGFVLFICSRWLEILYWPSLALIGLTSLAMLYYWNTTSKADNITSICIVVLCILILFGL